MSSETGNPPNSRPEGMSWEVTIDAHRRITLPDSVFEELRLGHGGRIVISRASGRTWIIQAPDQLSWIGSAEPLVTQIPSTRELDEGINRTTAEDDRASLSGLDDMDASKGSTEEFHKTYLSLTECVARGIYAVEARNFSLAVYDGETDFWGARRKFGDAYLFPESHRDTGGPHGTVSPIRFICMLPERLRIEDDDGVPVLEYLVKECGG